MGIRLWRWLAPVLVVALGAGAGAAFLVAGAVRPVVAPLVKAAGHQPCVSVQLLFRTDDAMSRAATALSGDPRAHHVLTATQAQTWAGFKKVSAKNPGLIARSSESAMPAVATVIPSPGTDLTAYAADLKQRFPEAWKVQQLDLEPVREQYTPLLPNFCS
ncbi:hypothetical protein VSH64_02495 [Amycolatopsis rhabdoformis]|uniref:FtsX extracellular domain-containing protein n=1 Tax=Amycolatopsis rhabdoformis TaxID=1448059 RepID=A0ABZ1IC30_9PSEU|nr:hypothetical protein [Amycolatopsis rhabdoformis]WSE31000.1 hypothetical protein VSH64_02495 [Amycolatopsis rhabdoformis]